MPRNAAKKTNKNAKRLPVLIKLTKINDNKKKKVNSNESINNNNNTSIKIRHNNNNSKNSTIRTTKKKNKQQSNRIKNTVNATFTKCYNKINDNCDAKDTISTYGNSTATTIKQNIPRPLKDNQTQRNFQQEQHQQHQDSFFKYFPQKLTHFKNINSDNFEEKDFKKQIEHLNIKNNDLRNDNHSYTFNNNTSVIKQSDISKIEVATNFTLTSETETTSATASTSSSPPPSTNSSISSLYPIVIDTSETLKRDDLNTNKKGKHSIYNCNNKNNKNNNKTNNNNNNNNNHKRNNNTNITRCYIAADTPKQQHNKSQGNPNGNKNSQNKNKSNNNNNNKITTSTCNIKNNRTLNQSQEVKARLATLRARKTVQQQRGQQFEKAAQENPCCLTATSLSRQASTKDVIRADTNRTKGPKGCIKRVPSVIDVETLNLIETLSDSEVKKPSNKRKRNTSELLSLAALHQSRPKRFATNNSQHIYAATGAGEKPNPTTITSVVGPVAVVNKNEQKQTDSNFVRPLAIETINTNSKKRPRIMSLYERPFQATNDGRGSVVGNGYMTSSRSSASSGGGGGGALVMNDTNDAQDMANQYYLSGTSGSGIAGNANASLVGNGSAINHAPTMGTLCNIGNTCYLNSVVYTLRFAPQFLHNLHHLLGDLNALQQNIARARAKSSSLGRGVNAVHIENARSWSSKDLASMEQYGSGTVAGTSTVAAGAHISNSTVLTQVTQKSSHQLLTEKLHELYQSLHRNEISESTEPHHADTLLHAIQDVSSIFEGNQQQDAHEFLMCLLNSIRETSQTLIKAIAECPDVILNGYISNPDEMERDLMKNHSTGGGNGTANNGSNSNNSNNIISSNLNASTSSKTSSFFSRKSKRKDESKNLKNSRLQSPLKDTFMAGNTQTTTTANSLFYLNTNDLNSTTPSSTTTTCASGSGGTTPSNSAPNMTVSAGSGTGDEPDASSAVALILKDKQRLENKIRELGLDFFNEDFEGITVSTTKCLSCETITEQKETMIDIAVPVPQAGYESNEFMDRPSSFIQNSCITREYFRNENKYRCEQCCGYTEAIRSISYEVLPRLLIIQLSRFSGGMEKINSYIPTSFTLRCFCSKCCELSDANKLHIYKLYSVITHVGATMSVGHYIAYTCSLDWANEYINCPKEQRRRASQERNQSTAGNGTAAATVNNSQSSTGGSSGLSSSGTSFMKMKMKFGRSKASSSGDMTKNMKQSNGLNNSSKAIINGIGKLTMNNSATNVAVTPQCPVTCQSINCCAMRLTAQQQLQYQSANNSTNDFSEEASQYSNGSGYNNPANYNNNVQHPNTASTSTSGYGSGGRGSTKASYAMQNNSTEPIWYMCDDDKIKAMTQREFEELLSPARKITITPYLLFYARYNLQSTPPKSATASSSSPGPVTSSPQTSWSNESLQSSGHSAHSTGMRM